MCGDQYRAVAERAVEQVERRVRGHRMKPVRRRAGQCLGGGPHPALGPVRPGDGHGVASGRG
ncbi:hypothetical protein, partial [Frankia sp. CcWB2]